MQLDAFLEKLFGAADQAGFEDYEAYYSRDDQFEVSVFEGEIDDYTVSGTLALSFRGRLSGCMGYASTQVLDDEAVTMLVDGARQNALIIESDDPQFIFEGSARYPELALYDERLDKTSALERIELAKALERDALELDQRVRQMQACTVFTASGFTRIVNSKGLDVSSKTGLAGGYISPVVREAERTQTAAAYTFGRELSVIDTRKLASDAVEEALDALTASPVPSGKYRVALRGDAAASLLAAFGGVFSAERAQKSLSLLKDREGEVIASQAVTLLDDPHHLTAPNSTPFDAEGVATYRKPVVERGVLTTLLHNLKTAAKQGVTTTANASKASVASPVDISASNFFFEPSGLSADKLLVKLGEGLLITELNGLHSGADAISGDFSLAARGYKVEGGKRSQAVDQITLAGNFYELLRDVVLVANDLKFGFPGSACYGSPTILISQLSVAGQE